MNGSTTAWGVLHDDCCASVTPLSDWGTTIEIVDASVLFSTPFTLIISVAKVHFFSVTVES